MQLFIHMYVHTDACECLCMYLCIYTYICMLCVYICRYVCEVAGGIVVKALKLIALWTGSAPVSILHSSRCFLALGILIFPQAGLSSPGLIYQVEHSSLSICPVCVSVRVCVCVYIHVCVCD